MKDLEKLIARAIEVKKRAYAPYSNFRVGCIVFTRLGNIYEGVNIENASYSPTLCAERNAISTAISQADRDILYIIIAGDSDYTYPCGVCRQFIREFATDQTRIIIAKNEKDYRTYTIDELLPYSFSKEDLGV